ncbi:MAG: chemotaxis protein CheW [Phycisphaerales bacterium]|nr:chemotaxis protein CheW [Phycisphaerales bacterium]
MAATPHLVLELAGRLYLLSTRQIIRMLRFDIDSIIRLPGCAGSYVGVLPDREGMLPAIDGRLSMGLRSFDDQLTDLRALLAAREADHVGWLNELRRCCTTGDEFAKATDPHKCAFGKWYDGLRQNESSMREITCGDPEISYIIDRFDVPHRAIHAIAAQALTHARAGELQEAQAVIDRAWETDLAAMKRLFASLLEGVERRRRQIAVILHGNGPTSALIVDAVRNVQSIELDRLEPNPAGQGAQPLCAQVYPDDKTGDVIPLIQADALLARDPRAAA